MAVGKLTVAGAGRFRSLRIRTENAEAARLYERVGFTLAAGVPSCTHTLALTHLSATNPAREFPGG